MQLASLFYLLLGSGSLVSLAPSFAPSLAPSVWAQTQGSIVREVYGNVTDFKGDPVAGASVALSDNQKTLVITNSEGKFLLRSNTAEPSLRITSAGYYDTIVVVPAANAAFSARLRPIANYKRQFKRQYKAVKRVYKNR